MPLNAADLSTLSRLLDEALDLAPATLETWLSSVGETHEHLLPMLREMLAEHRSPAHSRYLAAGPQLAAAFADAGVARVGDMIGPYRLTREIGRGGMACVWLAERPDGVVKRDVALKMPLLTLTSATQVERFERERDVLAMLCHPQIARLYDAGVGPGGQPYLVLEHVQGKPITEACNAARLDVPARLSVFLQVLAAVDHAHKHLVVHRDLKPSNVFVDAAGQVKLLDFGIAKLLGGSPGAVEPSPLTRDGGSVLTPRYAAPEQLEGRPISTATDVYALGLLLYELLVGELPHAAAQASVAQAVDAALHTEPMRPSRVVIDTMDAATAAERGLPPPERLRQQLAGDLDTIVLKALRKAPGERYSSVERFATDIERFLGSRPIEARPATAAHRLRLFARRHYAATLTTAAGCVAALVLAVLLVQQHTMTDAQEKRALAVREFMMDMIEDVNPDENHAQAEVTGKQMVTAGLARAHDRFKRQPLLLGEVLGELALMLRRLGDDAAADKTFAESLALLERHALGDDASLNKTRAYVAETAFDNNDMARAGTLALKARDACSTATPDCAKARALAGHLLAKIDLRGGRMKQAMQHRRQSVADFERGFGAGHAETASAWGELAVTAREAGDLPQADRAIRHALAIAERTVLRASDRAVLLRTQAVIELDLGRFASARTLLQNLVGKTTVRSELARQLRLLATAELALGLPDAALATADRALALADPARPSADMWFARQARARALSLLGRSAAAMPEMQQALQGLQALGYPPTSMAVLRTRRWMAEMLARQGDLDQAWTQIEPVVETMAAQAAGLSLELGQALELQGCIQRDRDRLAEAAALHQRANTLLQQQLPTDHPLLVRNALYRQRVQVLSAGTPQARETFERMASAYIQRFGPASNWSTLIAALHNPASCAATASRACLLIL